MLVIQHLKLLLPKLLALLLIFLGYVPSRLYGLDIFFPAVDLMLIYYWCLHKPQLMQNWFIFSAGVLKDVISAAPLGINALSFILLRGLVIYKAEYLKRSFMTLWQGFAAFAAVIIFFKWLVFSFVLEEFVAINAAVIQLVLSVLVYPVFHSLFNSINVILPRSHSDA